MARYAFYNKTAPPGKPVVVPVGTFTFQALCEANPSERPLVLLQFLTAQIARGQFTRTLGGAQGMQPIYTLTDATRQVHQPHPGDPPDPAQKAAKKGMARSTERPENRKRGCTIPIDWSTRPD